MSARPLPDLKLSAILEVLVTGRGRDILPGKISLPLPRIEGTDRGLRNVPLRGGFVELLANLKNLSLRKVQGIGYRVLGTLKLTV